MILSWRTGGLFLGLVFLAAVVLVKPIGVSTQFVIFDGMVWNSIDKTAVTQSTTNKSGYASSNPYLDKSGGAYAKNIAKPFNYSFVFVLAMIAGAAASAFLRGGVARPERSMPAIWRANYGDNPWKRYALAFASGFVVLYGARLASGCTSGHMMSGIMQTAVSGYIFTAGAFLAGIPVAIAMFPKDAR
jgi:uncharacterized protein